MSIQYLPIFLLLLITGLANAQPFAPEAPAVTPAAPAVTPAASVSPKVVVKNPNATTPRRKTATKIPDQIKAVAITKSSDQTKATDQAKSSDPAKTRDPAKLKLASANALIMDMDTSEIFYQRNPDAVVPIASVTKLMTAMVVLDDVANASLDEWITVDISQTKELQGVFSHVRTGSQLQRRDMLLIALMASENRAAATLAHHYSGGYPAFIKAMNAKAKALGMNNTRYIEPTGLSPENVSTPRDLARMVQAASRYPLIAEVTTTPKKDMVFRTPRTVRTFYNTNPLVRDDHWVIETSKTGFTDEAGRCLVLKAKIQQRHVAMVLLDSTGKHSHIGDAGRVRRWLETGNSGPINPAAKKTIQRRQKIAMVGKGRI